VEGLVPEIVNKKIKEKIIENKTFR